MACVCPSARLDYQSAHRELVAIFYREQLISIYKAHDKYQDMMKPVKVIRTEIVRMNMEIIEIRHPYDHAANS